MLCSLSWHRVLMVQRAAGWLLGSGRLRGCGRLSAWAGSTVRVPAGHASCRQGGWAAAQAGCTCSRVADIACAQAWRHWAGRGRF